MLSLPTAVRLFALLAQTAGVTESIAASSAAGAPLDPNAVYDMSLEELLHVNVATGHDQGVAQAPAIVSVINREDIDTYGCRTLADILRMVPGFEFGIDVSSLQGASFRGIWVHEGKMLLMLNGLVLNDPGYGNFTFYDTVPASMIQRVEIIRGPGSALYGQFAEAVVVNVITRRGADVRGVRISGRLDTMDFLAGGYAGEVTFGHTVGDLDVSASLGYSSAPMSRRVYSDFFGNSLRMNDESAFSQWDHILAQASFRGLNIRYRRNRVTSSAQDSFTTLVPRQGDVYTELQTYYREGGAISYRIEAIPHLTIEPYIEVSRATDIAHSVYPGAVSGLGDSSTDKMDEYTYELRLGYDFGTWGLLSGAAGYRRNAVFSIDNNNLPSLQTTADANVRVPNAYSDSKYALLMWEVGFATNALRLTLGARYEDTTFGAAFAPRGGITFDIERLNVKILYGRAFRVPLPWQAWEQAFIYSGSLRPETAESYELGLAYTFAPWIRAGINGFFIRVDSPIKYDGAANQYTNSKGIQSAGVEAELRIDKPRYGGFANASYAHPTSSTDPGVLTADRDAFLGMPAFKANIGAYWRPGNFSVGPSLTILTPRHGQSSASANSTTDDFSNTRYPAMALLNLSVTAHDILRGYAKGVDVSLSAHNILNQSYLLIQPYYGAHAPLPAYDRQFNVRLVWHYETDDTNG